MPKKKREPFTNLAGLVHGPQAARETLAATPRPPSAVLEDIAARYGLPAAELRELADRLRVLGHLAWRAANLPPVYLINKQLAGLRIDEQAKLQLGLAYGDDEADLFKADMEALDRMAARAEEISRELDVPAPIGKPPNRGRSTVLHVLARFWFEQKRTQARCTSGFDRPLTPNDGGRFVLEAATIICGETVNVGHLRKAQEAKNWPGKKQK